MALRKHPTKSKTKFLQIRQQILPNISSSKFLNIHHNKLYSYKIICIFFSFFPFFILLLIFLDVIFLLEQKEIFPITIFFFAHINIQFLFFLVNTHDIFILFILSICVTIIKVFSLILFQKTLLFCYIIFHILFVIYQFQSNLFQFLYKNCTFHVMALEYINTNLFYDLTFFNFYILLYICSHNKNHTQLDQQDFVLSCFIQIKKDPILQNNQQQYQQYRMTLVEEQFKTTLLTLFQLLSIISFYFFTLRFESQIQIFYIQIQINMIKSLDPHHQPNAYNWEGVMQFLYNQYQNCSQKENLWALQRDSLKEHIKELQGKLLGIQNINRDLKSRNNMLEYSLRQFKANQSQKHQKQNDEQEELPKMPQRRPKPNKIHLTKILCSLGIPNLLQDIKKDMQNKSHQSGLHLDLNKLQAQSFNARERKKQMESSSSQSQIKFQQLKPALTGHQDGVRDICFINKETSTQMISVSEDCTMKIWNVNKKQNRVMNIQCKGTIRQHAGPIFTCTEGDGYVFTAGMEGIIRVYDFSKETISSSQKSLSLKFKHNENQKLQPIWQLVYDKPRKLLIATSSQMEIKGYKCNEKNGKMSLDLSCKFSFKSAQDLKDDQDEYIPTAICLKNDSLYASYFNSDCIVQYDVQTNKMISKINCQIQESLSANRLISHPRCLIGAYQDFKVRLFDQNKLVKEFKAHDGPVMSGSLTSNYNYFFTCGHDGYVKLWDIRKCETVLNVLVHERKHDESIHCVSTNFDNLTVSGGADSIIKVFHQVY